MPEILTNQFGEVSINTVSTFSTPPPQANIDAVPAKTGVQSLAALSGSADLPTTVTQLNALLAALKAIV